MGDKVGPNEMFRVVATCIVYDPAAVPGAVNEYLILRRRGDLREFAGFWTTPGGGVEWEDYINLPQYKGGWPGVAEIAVNREVLQEAGVNIKEPRYIGSVSFVRRDGIHVVAIKFAAALASKREEVRLDPADSVEFRWIRAIETDNFNLLGSIADDIQRVEQLIPTWR